MIHFKIKVSSIVDIITNSSSEIFTIQSDKSRQFVIDMINEYCASIGFEYRVGEDDFTNPEEDWNFKDAVETLAKFGYKAVKVGENDGCYLELAFENNYGLSDNHYSLFNFLQNTLNAERTYG